MCERWSLVNMELLFNYWNGLSFFVATLNLAATGDGKEVTSCAGCNPAQEFCVPGCQSLITKVYWECDSVCLPDGYYYDPRKFSFHIQATIK